MKENSELLAQQAQSVKVQISSGPTIELVTPGAGRNMEQSGIICPPNCLPFCPPSCPPNIIKPPCFPEVGLPRPPRPPGPGR